MAEGRKRALLPGLRREADGRRREERLRVRSRKAGVALHRGRTEFRGPVAPPIRRDGGRPALHPERGSRRAGRRTDHPRPELDREGPAMTLAAGTKLGAYEIVAPI